MKTSIYIMTMQEQDIIQSILQGDSSRYAYVMDTYGPRVRAFVAGMVRNALDVEEIVGDTFIQAYRHLDSYDASCSRLITWIQRIAYRQVLQHLRRCRQECLSIDELGDASIAMSQDEDGHAWVNELILCLPPADRALIHLYYYEGMKLSEIAPMLEVTSASLATRLLRIRKKLYHLIQPQSL